MALRAGTAIATAALIALAPATAFAQETTVDGVEVQTDVVDDDKEGGDNGLWGLLGLLGLFAPLFNKKGDDVNVSRTTTTSGRNDGNPLT